MARKVLFSQYYTFNPTTRTVVVPQGIQREKIILITNVTSNQVIYNFSDSNNGFTSYTITTTTEPNIGVYTTMVLANACSGMSASDKLEILIDEYDEKFSPSETYTDPVNKFRTSQPQALIDTDFEYSTQATKWESLNLMNNRPFAYFNVQNPTSPTGISAVNGSRTITVTYASGAPAAGSIIFVQDTLFAGADGTYIVDTSAGGTTITYTARAVYTGTTGSIFVSGVSAVYTGTAYTGANIGITSITNSSTAVTVTTSIPHGLYVGNEIALTGTTASTNPPNGSWVVATITSPTVFVFYVTSAPTGAIAGGTLYARPLGTVNQRAFDGGVTFSTNTASDSNQMIRQTRRYFRYQSGKGIQVSTGTLLKPSYIVDAITSSGTTCTVLTKYPHNLAPNALVTIARCNETAYNGNFIVASIIDANRFTYTASTTPSATPATGVPQLNVTNWDGAAMRLGVFDSQNGIFFEYDGQQIYAVRRSSTTQISGFVSVTAGSSTVSGSTVLGQTTLFSKQLVPGDFIVIKGMSYKVMTISSDTTMTINPAYRGTTASGVIISKTIDLKTPQSQWNLDRMDGTGPSGFTIDLSKMQMFYMDYSWYGAGFIRWGFRTGNGDVVYCHKQINNNINQEAYMRSGNLPGRYEVNTFPQNALLTQTLSSGATTMYVSSNDQFFNANASVLGTLWINNSTQSEFVNYTGKGADATLSANVTAGSTVLSMPNTTGVVVGQYVQGTGIPRYTQVNAITTNTSVTMSQAATFTSTNSSILFNPTLTGLTRAQAGAAAGLTFTTTANSAVLTGASTVGLQVGQQIVNANITPGTAVVSFVANTSVTMSQGAVGSGSTTVLFPPMGNTTAQTFTVSSPNTNMTNVEQYSPGFSPTMNHWGTSVIMDGRFDNDKAFVFNRGMTTALSIAAAANNALMSFRIGPSVNNGQVASTLGTRELVNRMQMVMTNMDLFSNGQFLITLILNGTVSSATPNWTAQGGSSLAQYILHSATTTITGGENIFGFYLNTAGGSNFTTTSQDLASIRDMGTSILSGGAATGNTNIYPDGPDVITVMAQNIGSGSANCFARVSWTEAQA